MAALTHNTSQTQGLVCYSTSSEMVTCDLCNIARLMTAKTRGIISSMRSLSGLYLVIGIFVWTVLLALAGTILTLSTTRPRNIWFWRSSLIDQGASNTDIFKPFALPFGARETVSSGVQEHDIPAAMMFVTESLNMLLSMPVLCLWKAVWCPPQVWSSEIAWKPPLGGYKLQGRITSSSQYIGFWCLAKHICHTLSSVDLSYGSFLHNWNTHFMYNLRGCRIGPETIWWFQEASCICLCREAAFFLCCLLPDFQIQGLCALIAAESLSSLIGQDVNIDVSSVQGLYRSEWLRWSFFSLRRPSWRAHSMKASCRNKRSNLVHHSWRYA